MVVVSAFVVVHVVVVVIPVVDPTNQPLKFGKIRSETAEILMTLSLCSGWWVGGLKSISC